ncbi:PstS family phosphate ABC transporter substrate-binding protein [Streptomyces lushanensis]|uniref:PstS family phosphate ABC transporter substrate-binding protein n=1 Tax=Streptomyces lushanensis TaxID=1434255 RepID=UPI00083350CC|nr:substrate-binding domain-containing protein [Streptomyces lushanensis]
MDSIPWDVILAIFGVVVPIVAALYEFVLVGRKRLGYRIQMDTTATDTVHSEHAGALHQLRQGNGTLLVDPSFVLLRIENSGAINIDSNDYAVLDDDKVGIRVNFPGRTVAGAVVTELSDDFLRPSFAEGLGLGVRDGVIELPKVPLNRAAHYKVLAALEAIPEDGGRRRREGEAFEAPRIVGGIKGGVGSGGIQETKSRTGTPIQAVSLVCFLVLVIIAQFIVSVSGTESAVDCAKGELTLIGSTAFRPVLDDAVGEYRTTCPDADFTIETESSGKGAIRLNKVGEDDYEGPDLLAFSDGTVSDTNPMLVPRPIAFSLFTLVANKEAGVANLSMEQITRLFNGEIANWNDPSVGGSDRPVHLVDREGGSGTRGVFEERVLGGGGTATDNSEDCKTYTHEGTKGVIRCRRGSTEDVLNAVEDTPGAIGYSEIGLAKAHEKDLTLVSIGNQQASLEAADQGVYPFWETEYAYTYGKVSADSLTASFLRYLTNEVGKDIVRDHGHHPCDELEKPVVCRPVEEPTPTPSP